MTELSAVFIITIFLLAALTFAIYRTKRRSLDEATERELFPGESRGLFDSHHPEKTSRATSSETNKSTSDLATSLRERARRGDLTALSDAWASGDRELYNEILDLLVRREAHIENIRAVASTVVASETLRASRFLAESLLLAWKLTPDEIPLTDLLRIAALSDDAEVFDRVIEEVTVAWQKGSFRSKSAEELRLLFDSEFWVLSPEARRTGAGFLLKQKLAEVRRRLSADAPRSQTLSNGPGES